ncbi:MAG: ABC transporter [Chloroflexi bacterium]|nr:ABC transporter [Chloroflexota bacterium]
MGDHVIEVSDLCKTYTHEGKVTSVLSEINLTVEPNEFVSIIGPSASGKSTLLNIFAGLEEPSSGSISMSEFNYSDRLGQVAYMPQNDSLLPWRTVLDNAALPLEIRGFNRKVARAMIHSSLNDFGLSGFANFLPSKLSGGMRQRVALLRTIMTERQLLLLDEPFGALDALTREEMQGILHNLWRDYKKTIILVTHDVDESLILSDTIYVLSPRPGRIIKSLRVDLDRPRTYKDAKFIKLKADLLDFLKTPAESKLKANNKRPELHNA